MNLEYFNNFDKFIQNFGHRFLLILQRDNYVFNIDSQSFFNQFLLKLDFRFLNRCIKKLNRYFIIIFIIHLNIYKSLLLLE